MLPGFCYTMTKSYSGLRLPVVIVILGYVFSSVFHFIHDLVFVIGWNNKKSLTPNLS